MVKLINQHIKNGGQGLGGYNSKQQKIPLRCSASRYECLGKMIFFRECKGEKKNTKNIYLGSLGIKTELILPIGHREFQVPTNGPDKGYFGGGFSLT